jgi:hypothetical protein
MSGFFMPYFLKKTNVKQKINPLFLREFNRA